MDGKIPPSSYTVASSGPPPSRMIVGPYIASRPAYQMFQNQKPGQSLADLIAADMQAQAKADGRPNPVTEYPENRQYWIHNDVEEILPGLPGPIGPLLPPPPGAPAPAPAVVMPASSPAPESPVSPDVAPGAAPGPRATEAAAPGRAAVRLPAVAHASARPRVSPVLQQLARASYGSTSRSPHRAVPKRPSTPPAM